MSRNSGLVLYVVCFAVAAPALAQPVVINEVAWMGTTGSSSDEWIELHNPTGASVHGYFLLERTDDSSAPGVTADQIYTGALENGGEVLELRAAAGPAR